MGMRGIVLTGIGVDPIPLLRFVHVRPAARAELNFSESITWTLEDFGGRKPRPLEPTDPTPGRGQRMTGGKMHRSRGRHTAHKLFFGFTVFNGYSIETYQML
jgi:hypothetical protein